MSQIVPAKANYMLTISYARGASFDLHYYTNKHMPLCKSNWAPHVLAWNAATFEEGPYQVVAHCYYESKDAFEQAMGMKEQTKEIMDDVKNYTDTHPVTSSGAIVARD